MRLYGRNSVVERIRFNPASIKNIYLQNNYKDASYIHKKAKKNQIPLYVVPPSKIIKMCRTKNTQGILANVDDFQYIPYEELLEESLRKKTILFLDQIKDPQNLGAMLRVTACLGNFSIVLPNHNSVEVTETVLRIASGGENCIHISKVANINKAIRQAQEAGYWVVGSVVSEGKSVETIEFKFPVGVVIGSEEKGIRPIIRNQVDDLVTIPMLGKTLSFNVAHATTILCYEISKQRNNKRKK